MPLPKGKSNLQLALSLYYFSQVEYHVLLKRSNQSNDLDASQALEKAFKKMKDQSHFLGELYAYVLGDELAIEYRNWMQDKIGKSDKIIEPKNLQEIKKLYDLLT